MDGNNFIKNSSRLGRSGMRAAQLATHRRSNCLFIPLSRSGHLENSFNAAGLFLFCVEWNSITVLGKVSELIYVACNFCKDIMELIFLSFFDSEERLHENYSWPVSLLIM